MASYRPSSNSRSPIFTAARPDKQIKAVSGLLWGKTLPASRIQDNTAIGEVAILLFCGVTDRWRPACASRLSKNHFSSAAGVSVSHKPPLESVCRLKFLAAASLDARCTNDARDGW